MRVTLLAHTVMLQERVVTVEGRTWEAERGASDADSLAEFASRGCYKSYHKPNPRTRKNEDYLNHVISVGHESVLAHASATFFIEDVSRGLTHELIRSRFLAFSQESQRYVDTSQNGIALPPLVEQAGFEDAHRVMIEACADAFERYEELVSVFESRGVPRKQAREAARAVLPNATTTSLTVSGNLRAWRDFIKQRWSAQADREIRDLAGYLLHELRSIAPGTFQDIPGEPYT